jgi:hypothetical protein
MIDITEKQRREALEILDRIEALIRQQQARCEDILRILDDAAKPKFEAQIKNTLQRGEALFDMIDEFRKPKKENDDVAS